MQAATDPAYVVTLVHGTWADTRGWVAPGSFLRREMEQRLGSVVFREFPWISANTHAARAEAGVRLGRFIRGGHAQYPHARHYIIAHSHGGTVALHAMRDADANRAISGIVTLATPFVSARRRRFRPYVGMFTFLLATVPMVVGLAVVRTFPSRALGLAWILGGVVLTMVSELPLTKWLIDRGRHGQAEIIAAVVPPPVDPSRLLILCSRRDEAGWWLRALDLVAQAPFALAGVLLSLLGIVARVLMHAHFQQEAWTDVLGAAALLAVALLLFSGVLRWPGYGREWVWAHLLVAIGTDRTPRDPGGRAHTAYAFDVPRPSGREQGLRRRLRHKAICNAPAAVSAIGDWIGRGLRPVERS